MKVYSSDGSVLMEVKKLGFTDDNKLQFNWIRQDHELPNVASRSDDIDNTYRLQYQLAF